MNGRAHRKVGGLSRAALLAVIGLLVGCATTAAAPSTGPSTEVSPPYGEPDSPGAPAAQPDATPAAEGKLVTNLWVEADLREVLRDISAQAGTTIIADQTVQGIVSLAAKDMPLEECLQRLCDSGDYHFVRVKDYYIVGRALPGTGLFRRLADLHRVKLRHASTEQVKVLLPSTLARYVTHDKVNGVVMVVAPEDIRRRILDAVSLIDVPREQVAVEAIVFELSEAGAKQLGLDWQYQNRTLNLGTKNLVGTITYDEASDTAVYVDIMLRAIVQDQKGQVLANPRIIAMNGQEAEIFVGQEKYFSLLSGHAAYPYYRLESIQSGVTLKVTPHIGDDGRIVLDLAPEVSDAVKDWTRELANNGQENNNSSLPVVTRRRAKTSVAIQDGQTVVIGGLLLEHRRTMVEKVPLLGDMPLVGPVFQNTREFAEQKEIVLVITTHLVRDGLQLPDVRVSTGLQQRYVSPLDAMGGAAYGERR